MVLIGLRRDAVHVVCHGKGEMRYQPARGEAKGLLRTCESCYGSGLEKLGPESFLKPMPRWRLTLAPYAVPQLKQIAQVGDTAATATRTLQITFVEPLPFHVPLHRQPLHPVECPPLTRAIAASWPPSGS